MTAVKPTWHIPAACFSYCIYAWQATLTTVVWYWAMVCMYYVCI